MPRQATLPSKRLTLRAVLKDVSPLVARVLAVPDHIDLRDFHELFLSLLGWTSDPGYIIRIHAKEFNSFQRRSRSKPLQAFNLRRQEKFLYICSPLDLWEWEIRVLDVAEGNDGPLCLKGRGAAPPEHCGGPCGYRLMLTRQEGGAAIADPQAIAASMQLLSQIYQDEPDIDWPLFQEAVTEGWQRVETRLEESGPLEPTRFRLKEANERLVQWTQRRRWWR